VPEHTFAMASRRPEDLDETDEVATESGRLCFVPDSDPLVGHMADFFVRISLNSRSEPVIVMVDGRHAENPIKRARQICLIWPSIDQAPEDMVAVGTIEAACRGIIVGDPSMLYQPWFGSRWNLRNERLLAIRTAGRRHGLGSAYRTQSGEVAVSMRASTGPARYRVTRWGVGSLCLVATIFHGDDDTIPEIQ